MAQHRLAGKRQILLRAGAAHARADAGGGNEGESTGKSHWRGWQCARLENRHDDTPAGAHRSTGPGDASFIISASPYLPACRSDRRPHDMPMSLPDVI